jgi:hypothetical protein
MPELSGQPAELRFTLEITRAATGITETVEMVGYIVPDPQPQPPVIEGELS